MDSFSKPQKTQKKKSKVINGGGPWALQEPYETTVLHWFCGLQVSKPFETFEFFELFDSRKLQTI